jgi:hypothetical protein
MSSDRLTILMREIGTLVRGISMATSSGDDLSRQIEFLYSDRRDWPSHHAGRQRSYQHNTDRRHRDSS